MMMGDGRPDEDELFMRFIRDFDRQHEDEWARKERERTRARENRRRKKEAKEAERKEDQRRAQARADAVVRSIDNLRDPGRNRRERFFNGCNQCGKCLSNWTTLIAILLSLVLFIFFPWRIGYGAAGVIEGVDQNLSPGTKTIIATTFGGSIAGAMVGSREAANNQDLVLEYSCRFIGYGCGEPSEETPEIGPPEERLAIESPEEKKEDACSWYNVLRIGCKTENKIEHSDL